MSLRDDQVLMFTHTPSRIVKEWTPSTHTQDTPLMRVILDIEYVSFTTTTALVGSTSEATPTTAVGNWKCSRRVWDTLDQGVERILTDPKVTLRSQDCNEQPIFTSRTRFEANEDIVNLVLRGGPGKKAGSPPEHVVSEKKRLKHKK